MQLPLFKSKTAPGSAFGQSLRTLGVRMSSAWPDRFGRALRAWLAAHDPRPIRTLSLFSGGGGLDIGFHDCGFHAAQMVELSPKYAETLRANAGAGRMLGDAETICGDIAEYRPGALNVDFIIGGPPCQTFSAAGRRSNGVPGTTDPRGVLFEEYVRLLRSLKPRAFLFENVYGITGAQAGSAWDRIRSAFSDAGYRVAFRVLDAADYGVPQHRERLFIVGVRSGEYHFPRPTHGPDSQDDAPYYSAGAAVAGADTSGAERLGVGGRFGHLLTEIPPGLNYSFFTAKLGHPRPIFGWRSKFSDYLYKADPETPVRTIKAQGGLYTGPFSWENRAFTVAELKRLQSIPDDYILRGTRQVCIQQIGNSVPPQLARILALTIRSQVFGRPVPFVLDCVGSDEQLGFRQRKRLLTARYASKAETAHAAAPAKTRAARWRDRSTARSEKFTRHLSGGFRWSESPIEDANALKFAFTPTKGSWRLSGTLVGQPRNASAYEIRIRPAQNGRWPLPAPELLLRASSFDLPLFTGLWKAIEEMIDSHAHVADLVQLAAYYQYPSEIAATLTLRRCPPNAGLWKVLKAVTSGIGARRQLTASELAELWDVPTADVVGLMKIMRSLGFEVRDCHTNPQMPKGEYLVPYEFPSLTRHSVQLHKEFARDHA